MKEWKKGERRRTLCTLLGGEERLFLWDVAADGTGVWWCEVLPPTLALELVSED